MKYNIYGLCYRNKNFEQQYKIPLCSFESNSDNEAIEQVAYEIAKYEATSIIPHYNIGAQESQDWDSHSAKFESVEADDNYLDAETININIPDNTIAIYSVLHNVRDPIAHIERIYYIILIRDKKEERK